MTRASIDFKSVRETLSSSLDLLEYDDIVEWLNQAEHRCPQNTAAEHRSRTRPTPTKEEDVAERRFATTLEIRFAHSL